MRNIVISALKYSNIAKNSFGPAGAVSSHEEADQARGVGSVYETGNDQLFVDIKAKLRAVCQDQKRVDMSIATENGI